MTHPLTHDDAFALLPELALGMLPADEAEQLMEFVRTSPECQAELASLSAAARALDSSAPVASRDASLTRSMRDRLVARAATSLVADATGSVESDLGTVSRTPTEVQPLRLEPRTPNSVRRIPASASAAENGATGAAERGSDSDTATPVRRIGQPVSPLGRILPWMAVAASGGFLLLQLNKNGTLAAERDAARVALKAATVSQTQLAGKLASSDSLVNALTAASVSVVELVATGNQPPGGARMFWDRLANRWTMITHHMAPVPAGRTYQLWLVTTNAEKISAGTFNTDAKGRAVVQATYALGAASLAAIAITEEPAGGSPQPTGTILVAGAASSQ
jgi:anti-sigma-K factor RskA